MKFEITPKEIAKVGRTRDFIPAIAKKLFGCSNCYWRHTEDCPHFDTKDLTTDFPNSKICSKRQAWILSFVPDYDKKPSQYQFMQDLNKGMGYRRQQIEEEELSRLEELKKDLEAEGADPKEIAKIEAKIARAKNDWKYTWTQLLKYEGMQVKIETPKKVESKVLHIKPSDIMKLRRDFKDGKSKDI